MSTGSLPVMATDLTESAVLRGLSVGVSASGDPSDPAGSSGTPASLIAALRTIVGSAVPISSTPTGRSRQIAVLAGALAAARPSDATRIRTSRGRLWTAAQVGRPMIAARERSIRRGLAETHVDALVQYGAQFRAPTGFPTATFQDSTVWQAVRAYSWPHLRGLAQADVERLAGFEREVYASSVACCAATHWVAESLGADFGVPADRIHVVGVGANHVLPRPEGRDWSTPRFLFIGADWDRKNGAALVRAFRLVHEQIPNATLEIVGAHPPLDEAGVTAHGPLSLADPGDRETVERLLATSTVFVLPSKHEPAGIVYVEAATAGIASIGTTNGGASTCIGDAGRLVDPDSTDQLVGAMIELAQPEVAERLGARAYARSALFTWEKVTQRLVRALGLPGFDPADLAEFL
jgi:glycosyltransferase involved in cell wall biosynthesis